jgi:co-chaperonin GroES (HSP10)
VSRQEANDALAFAAAAMKQRYDKKHKAIEFKVGQKVIVRLYKGYQLPGETNRKLSH